MGSMREFTQHDKTNGEFAVREMSEKAQAGYQGADDLTVFEYEAADTVVIRPDWIRYAYIHGRHWQEGLTKDELQFYLERLKDSQDQEREGSGSDAEKRQA